MFKYTLKPHWKHYFYQSWTGGSYHVRYAHKNIFEEAGWPTDYASWWITTKEAYRLQLYSEKKLQQIPCGGYLIPVHFFNEETV